MLRRTGHIRRSRPERRYYLRRKALEERRSPTAPEFHDRGLGFLARLARTPRMWASDREAFTAQVATILEMLGVDHKTVRNFYVQNLGSNEAFAINLGKPLEDDWAVEVVDKALDILTASKA